MTHNPRFRKFFPNGDYTEAFVVLLRDFTLDGELWMEAGDVGEATLFPDGVKITDGTTIVDENPVEYVDYRFFHDT